MFKRIFWFIFMAAVLLAIFRTVPLENPSAIFEWGRNIGNEFKAIVETIISKLPEAPAPNPIDLNEVIPTTPTE